MQDKKKTVLINMVLIALLIAIQIILSRFGSIPTPIMKIGLAFIPIAFASKYIGIKEGMIVAGLGDLLGALLFPIGTYLPQLTITAILRAFLLGIIACKKTNLLTISTAVIVCEVVCSLLINTFWISLLYGDGFIALLPQRLLQSAIMTPVQILILYPMFTTLYKRIPNTYFQMLGATK